MKSRRKIWTVFFSTVAFGTFLFLNFTYPILFPSMAQAAEKGPIKIGCLGPKTGNFAQLGVDMIDGAKLFLETVNYTIAGRKIEMIFEDEGSPDQAVSKARKLIKHDKVDMIVGPFMTSIAYAVAPICVEEKVPLLITIAGGDELTQQKSSKWINRVSMTGSTVGHVLADYTYKTLGWRKAVAIGMDYQQGYETVGGFVDLFEDMGGKVISRQYAPVTTLDFGPYIAKIPKEADGILDIISGAASIRFLGSLQQSGLLEKMKVMAMGSGVDETFLQQIGEIALGVYSMYDYNISSTTPENIAFKELCRKKLNRDPTFASVSNWIGFSFLAKAIEALNGNVEDKEKLAKALREAELKTSIRGPIKIDKYGQLIGRNYIRTVEKVGGIYQNTVIATYADTDQFWPWDAKRVLSKPPYTRDYPPCKYCQ